MPDQILNTALAEREGFEPPMSLHPCRISSAVHSTTLPPLRLAWWHALSMGKCAGQAPGAIRFRRGLPLYSR